MTTAGNIYKNAEETAVRKVPETFLVPPMNANKSIRRHAAELHREKRLERLEQKVDLASPDAGTERHVKKAALLVLPAIAAKHIGRAVGNQLEKRRITARVLQSDLPPEEKVRVLENLPSAGHLRPALSALGGAALGGVAGAGLSTMLDNDVTLADPLMLSGLAAGAYGGGHFGAQRDIRRQVLQKQVEGSLPQFPLGASA